MWKAGGRAALLAARESIGTRSSWVPTRAQSGVTLIETLVALVLIGVVVISGLSGLFTMVVAADSNDDRARLEAGLTSYIESLKQMSVPEGTGPNPPFVAYPSACFATQAEAVKWYNDTYWSDTAWPAPQRWVPAANGPLAGATSKVTAVSYWNGSAFVSTCSTNTAQQITVELTWQNRSVSGVVVKRKL